MAMNYLAIFSASVASFVLGFLWYGPLFGKEWMKMMKFTPRSMKSMKMTPKQSMTLGFLTTLVTAGVLSLAMDFTSMTSIYEGVVLSFFIWLGFIATGSLGIVLWENKPIKLYILNNSYSLTNLVLMSVVLALFY